MHEGGTECKGTPALLLCVELFCYNPLLLRRKMISPRPFKLRLGDSEPLSTRISVVGLINVGDKCGLAVSDNLFVPITLTHQTMSSIYSETYGDCFSSIHYSVSLLSTVFVADQVRGFRPQNYSQPRRSNAWTSFGGEASWCFTSLYD